MNIWKIIIHFQSNGFNFLTFKQSNIMFFQNQLPLVLEIVVAVSTIVLVVKYIMNQFYIGRLKSDLENHESMILQQKSEIIALKKIISNNKSELESYEESFNQLNNKIKFREKTLDLIQKLIEKDRLKRKTLSNISLNSENELDDKKRKQLKSAITTLKKLMNNKIDNVNDLAFLIEVNMLIKNYEENSLFTSCFFFELNNTVNSELTSSIEPKDLV